MRTRRKTHLGVVLLGLLSTPDVCSFHGEQDFSLVIDDAIHDDVVEDRAEECSGCLSDESSAWWKLGSSRS